MVSKAVDQKMNYNTRGSEQRSYIEFQKDIMDPKMYETYSIIIQYKAQRSFKSGQIQHNTPCEYTWITRNLKDCHHRTFWFHELRLTLYFSAWVLFFKHCLSLKCKQEKEINALVNWQFSKQAQIYWMFRIRACGDSEIHTGGGRMELDEKSLATAGV